MEIFLLFTAILSITLLLATLFTPFVDTRVDTTSTTLLELGTPEFYKSIESITRSPMISLDTQVEILNNGNEFFPDLLGEIEGAKSSVTVANYIWAKGKVTDMVLDALTEKARNGVEVRVIMDGLGQMTVPKDKVQALKDAGGKVEVFRPLSFRTFTRTFRRSHLRAIVIDGNTAYVGGVAFKDPWLGDGVHPDSWRDMMFKVHGQAATEVQDMFSTLWRETDGEVLSGNAFYPINENYSLPTSSSRFTTLLHLPSPDLDKSLSQLLWISFASAKSHIHIETPYLMPDPTLLKVLRQKAEEGVEVEIIVPGKYIDSKSIQAASRSYYSELLDAGVHIYEYQPGLFHSKVFTVDGRWSVVGSANLDNRSSSLNVEGLMAVDDRPLAQGIEKEFALDKSRSVEVDKDTFKLNIFARVFGRLSRLFVKQY